jgi:hypothetical protein
MTNASVSPTTAESGSKPDCSIPLDQSGHRRNEHQTKYPANEILGARKYPNA